MEGERRGRRRRRGELDQSARAFFFGATEMAGGATRHVFPSPIAHASCYGKRRVCVCVHGRGKKFSRSSSFP